MGQLIDKLLGGGVNAITDGIDTLFTTKEEKQQLINELEALNQRDRESAREMSPTDRFMYKENPTNKGRRRKDRREEKNLN